MTTQKTIEWLEAIEEKYIHGGDELFDQKRKIAISNAVEALEKQIPKKLVYIGIEQCCPVCKEGICLIGDDGCYGNFCGNCGQALDWSENK